MGSATKFATVPQREQEARTYEIKPALIRCREAARYLGLSEWSIRQMAHNGELPYLQRTDRSPMLFDVADLQKWIERQKVRPNGQ